MLLHNGAYCCLSLASDISKNCADSIFFILTSVKTTKPATSSNINHSSPLLKALCSLLSKFIRKICLSFLVLVLFFSSPFLNVFLFHRKICLYSFFFYLSIWEDLNTNIVIIQSPK